jgi:hypothetical protein
VGPLEKGIIVRTRLVALIVVAAAALGVFGVSLLAFAYDAAVANPPDDSGPVVAWSPQPSAAPIHETAATLPLSTEADIPADFTAEQRADALGWLRWAGIVDDCMSRAGFDEYAYSIYWQPGFDPRGTPTDGLDPAASPEHKAAFALALNGSTGAAADYHWEDAGCLGAATHEVGGTN